jgi:hypothetical protein
MSLITAVGLGNLGGSGTSKMDGVDPGVDRGDIGDVAGLLKVCHRGDGEHKETKGPLLALEQTEMALALMDYGAH